MYATHRCDNNADVRIAMRKQIRLRRFYVCVIPLYALFEKGRALLQIRMARSVPGLGLDRAIRSSEGFRSRSTRSLMQRDRTAKARSGREMKIKLKNILAHAEPFRTPRGISRTKINRASRLADEGSNQDQSVRSRGC